MAKGTSSPESGGHRPLAPEQVENPSIIRRVLRGIRVLALGNPISSDRVEHTLLNKFLALPVFCSDAISSVAYATQEIVLYLGPATVGGIALWQAHTKVSDIYSHTTMIITGLIVMLLAIVVTSYWQTINAYPNGGGSYIVTKDNLGTFFGLVAAAAILIDYVLTVSVSIASGVQNLEGIPGVSTFLQINSDHIVIWCIFFVLVLTLANLRGLKESGKLFAIFTYGFVLFCYLMIGIAIFGPLLGWHPHTQYIQHTWHVKETGEAFGLILLMKTFANGCSAMTGTEAVADGIPAFKEPRAHNAALTLLIMGGILGTIFLGISWLAVVKFHVVYDGSPSADAVIDQISGAVFGHKGSLSAGYYLTQFLTAAVLVLAANTSFADFPRLSSILARDRFMPKQMSNLGDKLVFTNGILILGFASCLILAIKKGNVDALIPFYAIGVFTAFTCSQSAMVMRWRRLKVKGWKIKATINGIGSFATGLVLTDIILEKFSEGAAYIIVLVFAMVFIFHNIHKHYLDVAQQLKLANYHPPTHPQTNTVLVLVPALHRGVMPALEYARSLSADCRALHICIDTLGMSTLKERWEQWAPDVPLVILNSPFRELVKPLMNYLETVRLERTGHTITVVIPEFVPAKWWHAFLHGQSAARVKLALLGCEDVVVTNVRYYLQNMSEPPPLDGFSEEVYNGVLPLKTETPQIMNPDSAETSPQLAHDDAILSKGGAKNDH